MTRSGRPIACSRLAATRPAEVVPRQVRTGRPAHNASLVVVWALCGIEEQVGETVAGKMVGELHAWREDDPRARDPALLGLTSEILSGGRIDAEILLSEDQIRVAAARARAGLARRDVRRFDHVTLMRGAAAFAVATNALAVSCEANQAPAPSA